MAMKRAFVLGGTGFLGSSLVRHLVEAGVETHTLARASSDRGRIEEFGDALRIHTGDLTDLASLRAALRAVRPEVVFHLAASGVQHTLADDDSLFGGNVVAARNVLAATGVLDCRIVYSASSLEQRRSRAPLKESDPIEPVSAFGAHKAAATLLMHAAARFEGREVVILRPFSVYGPREPRRRLIPSAILAGLEQTVLPLTAPGFVRDFVFVDDVARAFLLAAEESRVSGEIFNVCSGVATSNESVVALIGECLGAAIRTKVGAYAPHATDARFWCGDRGKAQARLGWRPRFSLEEGIRATISWFEGRRLGDA